MNDNTAWFGLIAATREHYRPKRKADTQNDGKSCMKHVSDYGTGQRGLRLCELTGQSGYVNQTLNACVTSPSPSSRRRLDRSPHSSNVRLAIMRVGPFTRNVTLDLRAHTRRRTLAWAGRWRDRLARDATDRTAISVAERDRAVHPVDLQNR
jgi:hypothetical protein